MLEPSVTGRVGDDAQQDHAGSVAIAWQGGFELLNADWSLGSGRTVEFRLVETPGAEVVEHPMRRYQRRRGGRMGQRFHGVLVADGMTRPAYDGELMLCAWTDSDRGRSSKFWLDEEAGIHPLHGFDKRTAKAPGSMFAAVLVLIQDDGKVIDGEAEERLTKPRKRLSNDAHFMVTSALFIQYLTEHSGHTQILERKGLSWTPERAKAYVKTKLGIESLSDLDRDETVAEKFHEQIRRPYSRFAGREQ